MPRPKAAAAIPSGSAAPPVDGLVRARWVDANPTGVVNDVQGFIRYGDEFWVTDEQLATDRRLVAWDPDWVPDPDIEAAIRQHDTDLTGEEA